jgi:hypothetical protein
MEIVDFDKPIANLTNFDILPNDEFEPYNSKELTPSDCSYKIEYLFTNPGSKGDQYMLSAYFDKIYPRSKKIKSTNGHLQDNLWLDPVFGMVYTMFYEKPLFVGTEKCFSQIDFHD